jgi:hypothetical protein
VTCRDAGDEPEVRKPCNCIPTQKQVRLPGIPLAVENPRGKTAVAIRHEKVKK